MRVVACFSLALLSAGMAGCSDVNPSAPTAAFLNKAQLADFAVTGTTTLLALNQQSQLTAKVKSPQGLATVTDKVAWTSADSSIATVSSSGLVTSVAYGSTNVVARLNDQETTQRIDVIAPTSLALSGTTSFTTLARTNQLTLTARWPGDITRNVTSDAAWSSDAPAVATISSSGALRSVNFGSATITAKYQSLTVSVKVDVLVTFSSLIIQGLTNLNSIGATSALKVVATFTDVTTKDVTAETTWTTSDPNVVTVSPSSVLMATGFGLATITAHYQDHTRTATAVVTPSGTFVINGRVRDPGAGQGQGLGIAGFEIRNTRSGISTMSTATGYTLVGVMSGDHITYQKDGWETAEIVFNSPEDESSPAVQPVVLVPLGSTASIQTAPNDLVYNLGGTSCSPCRRVHITAGTATTARLRLSWTGTTSRLSIWANGQASTATSGTVVTADVPLSAGDNVVYVGLLGGAPFATNYMSLSLATSVATSEPAAVKR